MCRLCLYETYSYRIYKNLLSNLQVQLGWLRFSVPLGWPKSPTVSTCDAAWTHNDFAAAKNGLACSDMIKHFGEWIAAWAEEVQWASLSSVDLRKAHAAAGVGGDNICRWKFSGRPRRQRFRVHHR